MRIDAKSHSSSLVEAQADRVRKKAVSDGLVNTKPEGELKATSEKTEEEIENKQGETRPAPKAVSSKKPPPAKPKPSEISDNSPVVSSKKSPAKIDSTKPVSAETVDEKPKPKATKENSKQGNLNTPPVSASGKPIPPPPGPISKSGRPIPPPPGKGGRGPAPEMQRSGPNMQRRNQGQAGAQRNNAGQFRGARGTKPSGAPVADFLSKPGQGGKPTSGKPNSGRPGGPNQRPQRKKKGRRRRRQEELQPMDTPAYTPEDAPVPEGEIVIERASSSIDVCLLYTSPSPRDRTRSRMPSSA